MTKPALNDRRHALYRFYGAGDALLYIGITVNLPTRLLRHHDQKPWWQDIVRMTVEYLPSRDAVIAAEKAAIVDEGPRFNIQHNGATGIEAPRRAGPQGREDPNGIPSWTFSSRRSGYTRTEPLWLYWEVHCDPISDDYYIDEVSAEDLWEAWRDRYPRDENAEAIYGAGAVGISWFVEGPSTFESAPLCDLRAVTRGLRSGQYPLSDQEVAESCRDFLRFFSWPVDPKTGERLQWSRLPVIDKIWREHNIPEPSATKGGFIQEATGWKPAPLQPYVDADHLGEIAGFYPPSPRRAGA